MRSPVSEPATRASSTWLVVLPPELEERELDALRSELEGRGWSTDSSRGAEQTVLAVDGPRAPEELGALLRVRVEADVLPLLPDEHYRRLRLRRRFLSRLVAGLGLLILAGIVAPLVRFLRPPPEPIVPADLVRVAAADELAAGQAKLVRFRGHPVLLVRSAPQRWQALSATCTFLDDCLLEWDADRGQLSCSCHGCAFDPHGNVLHSPASIPLVRLEVVPLGKSLFLRSLL